MIRGSKIGLLDSTLELSIFVTKQQVTHPLHTYRNNNWQRTKLAAGIFYSALLLGCMNLSAAVAQNAKDTTEKLIQIQQLSRNEWYALVQQSWYANNDSTTRSNFRYRLALKYTKDDGANATYTRLDSVESILIGELHPSQLNIQFVSRSVGFLYGYAAYYAFYPILFRTENGGASWQKIIAGPAGTPMRRADFFMFNESKGILLNNWNSEPYFNYMLTNDGGKTWQQQRFKISRNDMRIMNTDEALNAVYSENGTVTVILKTLDSGYRSTAKVVVLESKDFGNSFKELH